MEFQSLSNFHLKVMLRYHNNNVSKLNLISFIHLCVVTA